MEIRNTGVGFSSDTGNNIFEKLFYRSDEAKENNPKGMGIGLTLARAIVNAHHGEFYIHSDGKNKGAIVKIVLPIDFTEDFKQI